ncbi:MAG: ExbD/TolR family protein [Gemmataceae bacterium]
MAAPGSQAANEQGLVPMLDMTLNLVMFFMMVANFSNEIYSPDIQLPFAQKAMAMERPDSDLMYINVTQDGHMEIVKLIGREVGKTPPEIDYLLREEARKRKANQQLRGDKSDDLKVVVIIRADSRAEYRHVYDIFQKCKQNGFTRLQVRAILKTGTVAI